MKQTPNIDSLIEDLDNEEEEHIETWHEIRLNSGSPENDSKISKMKERWDDFGRKTSELSDSLSLGRREQTCPASIETGFLIDSRAGVDQGHAGYQDHAIQEGHAGYQDHARQEGHAGYQDHARHQGQAGYQDHQGHAGYQDHERHLHHEEHNESDHNTSGIPSLNSASQDSFSGSFFPNALNEEFPSDLRLSNLEDSSPPAFEEINEGKGLGSESRGSTSRLTEICEEDEDENAELKAKIEEIESFISRKKTQGSADTILLDKLCKTLKDVETLGLHLEEEKNKKNEYTQELFVRKQSEKNASENRSQQLSRLKEAEDDLARLDRESNAVNNEVLELQSKIEKSIDVLQKLQEESDGLSERSSEVIESYVIKKGDYQTSRCQLDKLKKEKEAMSIQLQLKEEEVKKLTQDVWRETEAKFTEQINDSWTLLNEKKHKLDELKSEEKEELQNIQEMENKCQMSIQKNQESIKEKMIEIESLESAKKAKRQRITDQIKADEEKQQKEMKELIIKIEKLKQEIIIEENQYIEYEALNLQQAFRSLYEFDLTDSTSLDLSYLSLSKQEKSTVTAMKKKMQNKKEEDLSLMQWCIEQQGYQIQSLTEQLKHLWEALEGDGIEVVRNSTKLKSFVEGIPKAIWPADWESKLVGQFERKATVSQSKTKKAHELIGKLLEIIESLNTPRPKKEFNQIENLDPFTSPSDYSPNLDHLLKPFTSSSDYTPSIDPAVDPFKSPSHISSHIPHKEQAPTRSRSFIQETSVPKMSPRKEDGKEAAMWDGLDDD